MSLPARQQHALEEIELRLQAADPRLNSMFATFTRLAALEAMPPNEAIRRRRIARRLPQTVVVACVIVAALLGAVALALLTPTPQCPRIAAARVAHPAPAWVSVCHGSPSAGVPGSADRTK